MKLNKLNYLGLRCPLPVIKAYKILKVANPGSKFLIITDDPSAPEDFKNMTINAGYRIKIVNEKQNRFKIEIIT